VNRWPVPLAVKINNLLSNENRFGYIGEHDAHGTTDSETTRETLQISWQGVFRTIDSHLAARVPSARYLIQAKLLNKLVIGEPQHKLVLADSLVHLSLVGRILEYQANWNVLFLHTRARSACFFTRYAHIFAFALRHQAGLNRLENTPKARQLLFTSKILTLAFTTCLSRSRIRR
jgi:hypothetical protein